MVLLRNLNVKLKYLKKIVLVMMYRKKRSKYVNSTTLVSVMLILIVNSIILKKSVRSTSTLVSAIECFVRKDILEFVSFKVDVTEETNANCCII